MMINELSCCFEVMVSICLIDIVMTMFIKRKLDAQQENAFHMHHTG